MSCDTLHRHIYSVGLCGFSYVSTYTGIERKICYTWSMQTAFHLCGYFNVYWGGLSVQKLYCTQDKSGAFPLYVFGCEFSNCWTGKRVCHMKCRHIFFPWCVLCCDSLNEKLLRSTCHTRYKQRVFHPCDFFHVTSYWYNEQKHI